MIDPTLLPDKSTGYTAAQGEEPMLKKPKATRKPRGSYKPRAKKPKPEKPGFHILPPEVLQLIAYFLLPPPLTLANGFPSPLEAPYPPAKWNMTAGYASQPERLGSVPQGVIDLVHFSLCSRATYQSFASIRETLGGSCPPKPKIERSLSPVEIKSASPKEGRDDDPQTLAAANDGSEETKETESKGKRKRDGVDGRSRRESKNIAAKGGKRQLFLQVDHCGENGDNLMQLVMASRESLEDLVVYKVSYLATKRGSTLTSKCGMNHKTSQPRNPYSTLDQDVPLNSTSPLQALLDNSSDTAPLPQLKSLQIGPKLCTSCVMICLRLFCAKRFYKSDPDHTGKYSWDLRRSQSGYNASRYLVEDFDATAAPNLQALQIYFANEGTDRINRNLDRMAFTRYLDVIHPSIGEKLQVLSAILPSMDRKWGGFGIMGSSTSVVQRTRTAAEKALEERAKVCVASSRRNVTLAAKENRDVGKIADKYALQAKAALPRRPIQMRRGDGDANALAAALVSSIASTPTMGIKGAEKGNGEAPKASNKVHSPSHRNIANPAAASNPFQPSKSVSAETVTSRAVHGSFTTSAPSNGLDSIPIDPQLIDDTSIAGVLAGISDEEIVKHVKLDAIGPIDGGPATEEDPDRGLRSPSPASEEEDNGESRDRAESQGESKTATTTEGRKARKRSSHERTAVVWLKQVAEHLPILLRKIAHSFPELAALQVLRAGVRRVDVVEGVLTVDEYARIFVKPLARMSNLRTIDLGLAVVGKKEAQDFPLGVVLPVIDLSKITIERARELAVQRKLLDRDIERAISEGDAWRLKVLERFVLGKSDGELPDSTSRFHEVLHENQPHWMTTPGDDDDDDGSGGSSLSTWPKGVQGGFVWSANLKTRGTGRGQGRGMLTTWIKEKGQIGLSRQPVRLA